MKTLMKIKFRIKKWIRMNRKNIERVLLSGLVGFLMCLVTTSCNFRSGREALENDEKAQMEAAMVQVTYAPERETPTQNEDSEYKEDAECIARVLYGTARFNSEEDQKLVVWCIFNRTESTMYPETIEEVCKQKSQWMAYSDDNPVLQNLYDLAVGELEVLNDGGHRPVSPDFIYMSWSANEIVLRDTFEENSRTHYWRS